MLRDLRERKGLRLREGAAEADMDASVLSKIELGHRLPTPGQVKALARSYGVAAAQIAAAVITEKFLKDAERDPEAGALAMARIEEGAGEYLANNVRTAVSKRGAAVNKGKKKK